MQGHLQPEEGFPAERVLTIVKAMADSFSEVGVSIVSCIPRLLVGVVDGVFITTTGVGEILEGVNQLVQMLNLARSS